MEDVLGRSVFIVEAPTHKQFPVNGWKTLPGGSEPWPAGTLETMLRKAKAKAKVASLKRTQFDTTGHI